MANKKPRTEKQLEALALGRAKAAEKRAANKARKKGVDTTGSAGDDPNDLPPGAPKVTTTPYQAVGDSPEQKKRKADGEPAPEPPPETPGKPDAGKGGTDSGESPETSRKRRSLLGEIAYGLGIGSDD